MLCSLAIIEYTVFDRKILITLQIISQVRLKTPSEGETKNGRFPIFNHSEYLNTKKEANTMHNYTSESLPKKVF